jgi:uncharacterized phage-like protein YoqJ
MEYTACFTGHRPQNLPCGFDEYHPACLKIKRQLLRMIIGLIEKKHVTHFISGMAIGTDMWAAEIVLELKEEYPNITLEAAIPCRSQPNVWKDSLKKRHNEILSQCDKVTLLQENYTSDCMIKRNRYMVDKSDYIVAVWNGKPSGTGNTIEYAVKRKRTVYCIDAVTFKMRILNERRYDT